MSEANTELAQRNRCISVDHQTRIPNAALRALGQAGVAYISTRSIGYNHINVKYAEEPRHHASGTCRTRPTASPTTR